jgi:hypothetical protein
MGKQAAGRQALAPVGLLPAALEAVCTRGQEHGTPADWPRGEPSGWERAASPSSVDDGWRMHDRHAALVPKDA